MFKRLTGLFARKPKPASTSKTHETELGKSFERGPIYDFKEMMNTGGKVLPLQFSAKFISSMEAKQIPKDWRVGSESMMSVAQANCVTLLAVTYSTFADDGVKKCLEAFPKVPNLTIRPILNPLKWMLWSKLMKPAFNTIATLRDLPSSYKVFETENKLAGYIFLLDKHGFIRWKAAGPLSSVELESLKDAINKLSRTGSEA